MTPRAFARKRGGLLARTLRQDPRQLDLAHRKTASATMVLAAGRLPSSRRCIIAPQSICRAVRAPHLNQDASYPHL